MAKSSTFSALLQELASRWGLSSLKLDEFGRCLLSSGELDLCLQAGTNENVFCLWAVMAEIPKGEEQLQVFAALLDLNHNDAQLRGACFCIDHSIDRILLKFQSAVDGLDSVSLENILNNFVEIAQDKQQKIDQIISDMVQNASNQNTESGSDGVPSLLPGAFLRC